MRLRTVSISVFLLFVSPAAWSWKVGNIESGMAQEAAFDVLRKEGFRVNTGQVSEGLAVAVQGNALRILSLCKGRVVSYSVMVEGGITAFIKMVKAETDKRGPGILKAESDVAEAGEVNTLGVRWPTPEGAFAINYVARSKATTEGASFYHSLENECGRK